MQASNDGQVTLQANYTYADLHFKGDGSCKTSGTQNAEKGKSCSEQRTLVGGIVEVLP
jgi:hypothetical protein